jgi:two-component system, OmpR family, sensor kinase
VRSDAKNQRRVVVDVAADHIPLAEMYEFVATVAHELRSRMAPIPLQMELLRTRIRQEGPLPERIEQVLGRLDVTVSLCLRRAGMLLEASRIASGRVGLRPALVDMVKAAAEIIAHYAPVAEMAHTSIALEAPAGAEGNWDRAAVEQVLDNLVSNALERSHQRPIGVSIAIEDGMCQVAIRDEGSRITPEEIAAVCEPFYRGSSAQVGDLSGLSLWVTRRLCEAMGGSLAISGRGDSEPTFRVRLPLSQDRRPS